MGEPACLMSELDDEGRVIERPEPIIVSDPSQLVEDASGATQPPRDRDPS